MSNQIPPPKDRNPLRDSWRPDDKADEAAVDNPREFASASGAVEDADGPVLQPIKKTHGENPVEKPPRP